MRILIDLGSITYYLYNDVSIFKLHFNIESDIAYKVALLNYFRPQAIKLKMI